MGFINEYEGGWPWRILLIEDDPADEKMIRKCLAHRRIRCDLIVLEDGRKAVEFLEESEHSSRVKCPDLILLDIGLPHHDGLEILKRIRANGRCGQASVIVVTGDDSPECHAATVKHAAKHCFKKTANYEEFLKLGDIIKEVLETGNASRTD
jgi:DNA-binding response OmpR family regulator